MKLTINLRYDADQSPGPSTVEVQADIVREDPAAETEAAAGFVGDVLHFARPTTQVQAGSALERYAEEFPAPASEPRRCARVSCGHSPGEHGNLDAVGRKVTAGTGGCVACDGPQCWSFVESLARPALSAVPADRSRS